MGVIKNDVGRPSNKTILLRRTLKLILVLIIIGLAVILGYFIKEKEKAKTNNENKANTEENISIYEKYKELNFSRKNRYTAEAGVSLEITSDGMLKAFGQESADYLPGEEIKVSGYGKNPKYLAEFNFNEVAMSTFAELTEDGNLYLGDYTENGIEFKKLETQYKILDMAIVDENYGFDLYVLTNTNKLYRVSSTYNSTGYDYKLDNLYEERTIQINDGSGLMGFITISKKDGIVDIYGRNIIYKNKKVDVDSIVISAGLKSVLMLFVTKENKILSYSATWEEYNKIMSEEKNGNIVLKKYNDNNVKSITTNYYKNSMLYDSSEKENVTIIYENGEKEIIDNVFDTYNVKYSTK